MIFWKNKVQWLWYKINVLITAQTFIILPFAAGFTDMPIQSRCSNDGSGVTPGNSAARACILFHTASLSTSL